MKKSQMKQFVALIRGPQSCGKTSINKLIKQMHRDKIFCFSIDDLKYSINKAVTYEREELAREIIFMTAKKMVMRGYSLILDDLFVSEEQIYNFRKLAMQNNLDFFIFRLTIPQEELEKRLNIRKSNQKVISKEKALYFEELLIKQNVVGEIVVNTEKKSIYEVTREIINGIGLRNISEEFVKLLPDRRLTDANDDAFIMQDACCMPDKKTLISQIRKNEQMIEWLHKNKHFFSVKMNGYNNIPKNSYTATLPLIDRGGKIIDLGCGNGMLLNFILQFSGYHLIPYGIDLNKEAIQQAKTDVLPEYADNFIAGDIKDYMYKDGPFDIIISSLSHSIGDPKDHIKKCMNALKPGGRVIYVFYYDVIHQSGITSLDEYVDEFNMVFSYGCEILFGTIYKK